MTETNEPFVFLNIYSAHFSQIHKKKERKKPGEVTTGSEPSHFLHSGVDFCRQRQETRKVFLTRFIILRQGFKLFGLFYPRVGLVSISFFNSFMETPPYVLPHSECV